MDFSIHRHLVGLLAQRPVIKHPHSLFFPECELGSHPYETIDKMIALYILIALKTGVNTIIEECQTEWWEHVQRMEHQ
jgi:hypothetical protein